MNESGALNSSSWSVQPPSANGVAQASMSKADKDKREKTSDGNPSCVGLYVDALDSKNLWAEGKIISCSTKKQLVKVHFPGWHKRHDVWNDVGSIAAHGAFAPSRHKVGPSSWDGDVGVFRWKIDNKPMPATLKLNFEAPTPSKQQNSRRRSRSSVSTSHEVAPESKRRKSNEPDEFIDEGTKENCSNGVDADNLPPRHANVLEPDSPSSRQDGPPRKNRTRPPARTKASKKDPAMDDGDAARQENLDEMQATTQFLQKCADIWKRQLSAASFGLTSKPVS